MIASTYAVLAYYLDRWALQKASEAKASDRAELVAEITKSLPKPAASALRKQGSELAAEVQDFVKETENRAMAGLTPGQGLSPSQQRRVERVFTEGVKEYHRRFNKRISNWLREVSVSTGKDTEQLRKDASSISGEALIPATDIGNRINAIANALP